LVCVGESHRHSLLLTILSPSTNPIHASTYKVVSFSLNSLLSTLFTYLTPIHKQTSFFMLNSNFYKASEVQNTKAKLEELILKLIMRWLEESPYLNNEGFLNKMKGLEG
jgi:hypothetical protein